MCQDVSKGGLNMISIKDQQKVFQIKWIINASNLENASSQLANILTSELGGIEYICKNKLRNPTSFFKNITIWQRAACT